MTGEVFEVPPRKWDEIEAIAQSLRELLRVKAHRFPLIRMLEFYLPTLMPQFHYAIKDAEEMGDNHGLTFPEQDELWLREDVYANVLAERGRDRFTLAHEFGHLFLHRGPAMARKLRPANELKPYRNSEMQANHFAACLLMPCESVQALRDPALVTHECGVTIEAASVRVRVLTERGKI